MSERTVLDRREPCGRCPAGTYAYGAILGGIELFAGCADVRDALRTAPRCRTRPGQLCAGCRDFIQASDFPIDRRAMLEELERA